MPGSLPRAVSELSQAGNQLNRARVIKTLEGLHQRASNTKRSRNSAQPAIACVEVRAQVNKNIVARSIASFHIQRREASGNTTIAKTRKRVDWIELISPAGYQGAAKKRIKEIFPAHCYRQGFVRLARERHSLTGPGFAHRSAAHVLRRAASEKPVGHAKLDLVGVGNRIVIVEPDYAIEFVDAGYLAIDNVRLDHMSKKERAVTAAKIFCQRRRPDVQLKLAIASRQIRAQHVSIGRIQGV